MKFTVSPRKLVVSLISPQVWSYRENGNLFLDYGKAWFGSLLLPPFKQSGMSVYLGECKGSENSVHRQPSGSIRFCKIKLPVPESQEAYRLVIPPDKRNTGPAAIKMPDERGEVFPFRYAEIKNPGKIRPQDIILEACHYPFSDDASSFECDNDVLNQVWELCKHSIKATTFCGVYVDGDRERIPYEADAYINQLGHYCVDSEYDMARYSLEYLIQRPTWPTEWQMHIVLMAWSDYLYKGDLNTINAFYQDIKLKTLIDLESDTALISLKSEACTREFEEKLHLHNPYYGFKHGLRDLVDWPPGSFTQDGQGERDGHEMCDVNTVVNAFHYRSLTLMSRIAALLDKKDDQMLFRERAELLKKSFHSAFFDVERERYIDGVGSEHSSLHSNMFALVFGLVPSEYKDRVLQFIKSRGMACSVYGAQYLLEALYQNGEGAAALALMTARHDRSWWNMISQGSTMTWEAWDWKYKNNLDWNHAWGAAPANIIMRYIAGVRPQAGGDEETGDIIIQPCPDGLKRFRCTVPLRQGSVRMNWESTDSGAYSLSFSIPTHCRARLILPHNRAVSGEYYTEGRYTLVWNQEVKGQVLDLENSSGTK